MLRTDLRIPLVPIALWAFCHPPTLNACDLPVFRYALEVWEPAPYEAVVFHRGPLASEDRAVLDRLTEKERDTLTPVNLNVIAIDLNGQPDEANLARHETHCREQLPCLVVLYPHPAGRERVLWVGRPRDCNVASLVNSPVRREIASRLLRGDAALWVLVESGRKDADDAAADLLTAELTRAEETFGPGASFSAVRVSRADEAERTLVAMLLRTEPDLHKYADTPIVFPIYGRGRTLHALVGKGINPRMVRKACAFLTGPCSCDAKESARGPGLLMTADWAGGVELLRAGPDTSTPPPPQPTPPVAGKKTVGGGHLARNLAIVLAAMVVVAAGGTFAIRRGAKANGTAPRSSDRCRPGLGDRQP